MSNHNSDQADNYLWSLRHSCEHVLTQAMQHLYPNQFLMAMGPATDEGFYFDFESLGNFKLSEEMFPQIEAEMQKIIQSNLPIIKSSISGDEAKNMFSNNPYKLEWIEQFLKEKKDLTVYKTGEEFVDLCAGPHIESTGKIGAFKLLSVAGAYWHGSEKNKMLTRIYGTAFTNKSELEDYLNRLEEIKKRDHRKIGKELDLFTFADEVGPGLPLWTPKGTIIREELENWAKETEKKWGYLRVATPHIAKHTLYEISGHLPYYKDDMYSPMDIDGENYYLKGMNCPHHHMIYKSTPKSYRDLPLRIAEYGTVYRFEGSGTLQGLMRVRSICQNDAHIYCTIEQAEQEFLRSLELYDYYYQTLGLSKKDYYAVIGLPSPEKSKYHGDQKMWELAEKMTRSAVEKFGIDYVEDVGGAAFYGPKIDVKIKSTTGKEYAISTAQLDLYMPTRFGLDYTDSDGQKKICAVIHRAPLGSHERFVGFLIEHFAGAFPTWLAPIQVSLIPITDKQFDYAKFIGEKLTNANIRFEIQQDTGTMQAKIKQAQTQKIPYMFILGSKEQESQTVSIRQRDGQQLNNLDSSELITNLTNQIQQKSLSLLK